MTKKFLLLVILLLISIPNVVSLSNYAFAQSVDSAWVRRYNGWGNNLDEAHAIAVDDAGNVYVTGYSYVGGASTYPFDYVTIKYYPNGDTAWVERYNGPADNWDEASDIAVDESGDVFVTGQSDGGGPFSFDYATIKYLPSGDTGWVRRYDREGFGDGATVIDLDGSGYVYVTGTSMASATSGDYTTIKYYPSAETAWVRTYNGLSSYGDAARAIAVDVSGNVYVTGWSYGSGTIADYATIKYYPNGDSAWVRRYNGPGNWDDEACAIAVDSSGNVYVTGKSVGIGTSWDFATIKYDSLGNELWVQRYNEPEFGYDEAYALALDRSGNAYVTGYSYSSGTSYDYATIKYYPNGDTAWVRRYNKAGNGDDVAYAIAIDGSDNVYVTGSSGTIKYTSNGSQIWVAPWGGIDIALDDSNNVYVTGGSEEYVTIKYFQFFRGDCDNDRLVSVADIIFLANYILKGSPAPDPLQSGDVNCDGKYDLVDVILLARYNFIGIPFPC
jgi:hypothetical protein